MKLLLDRSALISQRLFKSLYPIFAGIATAFTSESIKSLALQTKVKHASSDALHSTYMRSADWIRFVLPRQ